MKNPARMTISKSRRRVGIYGVGPISRYCIRFGTGIPMEFLIRSYDKRRSREWQATFARCAAQALIKMAERLEGRP